MPARIPFASTSSVSLAIVTPGAFNEVKAQFSTEAMTNTLRAPIQVREIRFMVDSRPRAGAPTFGDDSMLVFLEGKFGGHYLTDGRVPLAAIAPYKTQSNVVDIYDIANSTQAIVTCRRLIFPKPLYLSPGVGFDFNVSIPPTLLLANTLGDRDVIVYMTLIGDYLTSQDAKPRMTDVPFISSTVLTQSDLFSAEGELSNPLPKTLAVKCLVSASPNLTGLSAAQDGGFLSAVVAEFKFPDASPLTEDSVSIRRALFPQMHVLPVKFDLPASSRIRARISADATDALGFQEYYIALQGTRPEVTP